MELLNSLILAAESTAVANEALISATQNAADQIRANVNGMLPITLSLMGFVLAIMVGVGIFKKLTRKAG